MEGHNETLNPPLPCHVRLDPATGINEGVHLSSLLRALETRGMTDAPRRALADGGVPRVPDEVRRLADEFERYAAIGESGAAYRYAAKKVREAIRISEERALAAAASVPRCIDVTGE